MPNLLLGQNEKELTLSLPMPPSQSVPSQPPYFPLEAGSHPFSGIPQTVLGQTRTRSIFPKKILLLAFAALALVIGMDFKFLSSAMATDAKAPDVYSLEKRKGPKMTGPPHIIEEVTLDNNTYIMTAHWNELFVRLYPVVNSTIIEEKMEPFFFPGLQGNVLAVGVFSNEEKSFFFVQSSSQSYVYNYPNGNEIYNGKFQNDWILKDKGVSKGVNFPSKGIAWVLSANDVMNQFVFSSPDNFLNSSHSNPGVAAKNLGNFVVDFGEKKYMAFYKTNSIANFTEKEYGKLSVDQNIQGFSGDHVLHPQEIMLYPVTKNTSENKSIKKLENDESRAFLVNTTHGFLVSSFRGITCYEKSIIEIHRVSNDGSYSPESESFQAFYSAPLCDKNAELDGYTGQQMEEGAVEMTMVHGNEYLAVSSKYWQYTGAVYFFGNLGSGPPENFSKTVIGNSPLNLVVFSSIQAYVVSNLNVLTYMDENFKVKHQLKVGKMIRTIWKGEDSEDEVSVFFLQSGESEANQTETVHEWVISFSNKTEPYTKNYTLDETNFKNIWEGNAWNNKTKWNILLLHTEKLVMYNFTEDLVLQKENEISFQIDKKISQYASLKSRQLICLIKEVPNAAFLLEYQKIWAIDLSNGTSQSIIDTEAVLSSLTYSYSRKTILFTSIGDGEQGKLFQIMNVSFEDVLNKDYKLLVGTLVNGAENMTKIVKINDNRFLGLDYGMQTIQLIRIISQESSVSVNVSFLKASLFKSKDFNSYDGKILYPRLFDATYIPNTRSILALSNMGMMIMDFANISFFGDEINFFSDFGCVSLDREYNCTECESGQCTTCQKLSNSEVVEKMNCNKTKEWEFPDLPETYPDDYQEATTTSTSSDSSSEGGRDAFSSSDSPSEGGRDASPSSDSPSEGGRDASSSSDSPSEGGSDAPSSSETSSSNTTIDSSETHNSSSDKTNESPETFKFRIRIESNRTNQIFLEIITKVNLKDENKRKELNAFLRAWKIILKFKETREPIDTGLYLVEPFVYDPDSQSSGSLRRLQEEETQTIVSKVDYYGNLFADCLLVAEYSDGGSFAQNYALENNFDEFENDENSTITLVPGKSVLPLTSAEETYMKIGEAAGYAAVGATAGSYTPIIFFGSGVLALLWNSVEILQLIDIVKYLDIIYPENMNNFFNVLDTFNFEFLQDQILPCKTGIGDIYENITNGDPVENKTDYYVVDCVQLVEENPTTDNFLGDDKTANFFINIGNISFIIFVGFSIHVFFLLLLCIIRKTKKTQQAEATQAKVTPDEATKTKDTPKKTEGETDVEAQKKEKKAKKEGGEGESQKEQAQRRTLSLKLPKLDEITEKVETYSQTTVSSIHWTFYFRALVEANMVICIFASLQISFLNFTDRSFTFNTILDFASFLMAIVALIGCFYFPFFWGKFIIQVRDKIESGDEDTKERYGDFLSGFQRNSPYLRNYVIFCVGRRIIIGFLVPTLTSFPIIILLVFCLLSILHLVFLLKFRPHKISTPLQVMNEFFLLCLYALLILMKSYDHLNWMMSGRTRTNYGWLALFFIITILMSQVCVILYHLGNDIKEWCRERKKTKEKEKTEELEMTERNQKNEEKDEEKEGNDPKGLVKVEGGKSYTPGKTKFIDSRFVKRKNQEEETIPKEFEKSEVNES